MKPKLILCLALVLSGGLLGCSTIALGAGIQLQVSSDFPGVVRLYRPTPG